MRVNPKGQLVQTNTNRQLHDNSQNLLKPQIERPRSSRPKSALRVANQKEVQQGSKIYMGINQVLKYQFQTNIIYFVPCYMRMRVLRVNEINYIESKAEIEAEVRIWLQIKEFPECVQEEIINQAKLQINNTEKIQFQNIRQPKKLDQSQIKNYAKNAVGFMYSDKMQLNIQSDPFLSPYQEVKLFANLEIKKIQLGQANPQFKKTLMAETKNRWQEYWQRDVQFNFIDANSFLQFQFEVGKLGCFDIVERDVDMKYSSDNLNEEEQNQQQKQEEGKALQAVGQLIGQKSIQDKMKDGQITPDAYEHGRITIPLYRYPSTILINVFVPLFIVGIMSFGVFFEDNDMSNRDQGLAAYLLAYIAFLPTIRENLPETPKLVFTQILVYLQVACSLICFFYSLYVNKMETYKFVWSEVPAFLACMVITIINILIVITMFLVHKLVWQRSYNTLPQGGQQASNAKSINTDDSAAWFNKPCQQAFKPFMDLNHLKPYVPKILSELNQKNIYNQRSARGGDQERIDGQDISVIH